MANIPANIFKNWNNGETMTEADYEREREIIRVAINDNNATADLANEYATAALSGINDIVLGSIPDRSITEEKLSFAVVPSGGIIMWGGQYAAIPTGWNLCDGSSGTPDLRDRFILGATTEATIGETGGSHSVTLIEAQMPSHNHSGSTASAGSHIHTLSITSQAGANEPTIGATTGNTITSDGRSTNSAGSHTHTVTIGSTGGGQSHENRPAFYKLAYIMKL